MSRRRPTRRCYEHSARQLDATITVNWTLHLGSLDCSYLDGYIVPVYQLQQSEVFGNWLFDLRDMCAKARILALGICSPREYG